MKASVHLFFFFNVTNQLHTWWGNKGVRSLQIIKEKKKLKDNELRLPRGKEDGRWFWGSFDSLPVLCGGCFVLDMQKHIYIYIYIRFTSLLEFHRSFECRYP